MVSDLNKLFHLDFRRAIIHLNSHKTSRLWLTQGITSNLQRFGEFKLLTSDDMF